LFSFSYSRIDTEPSSEVGIINEDCIVTVETNDDGVSDNNLVSRLSSMMSRYHDTGSNHDVIVEPPQVLAFHLKNNRSAQPSTTSSSSAVGGLSHAQQKGFRYPKVLYLDQFLSENFLLANEKRKQQMEMNAEVQKLSALRNSITHFNVGVYISGRYGLARIAFSSSSYILREKTR
jgi:hypothetical protein